MDFSSSQQPPIKSALFVDFDNIYIGLSKTDPQAAERFASDPGRWLEWLERGMPNRAAGPNGELRRRSILIRRCYPNPDAGFRRFRSFFTSAAFSVIDCPSMTRAGKNSADIYMVMDILDTLNHRTAFDEFIVFSGDSDFMPVLLRLRAFDRRTTTLAIDFMPPAYRAACDVVISEEEFIEEALGISSEGNCGGPGAGRARVSVAVLKEMASRVYEAACDEGEVAGADLPEILKDFRVFRESNNWLGFGTSQRLAEALTCSEERLHLVRLNPTLYKIVLKAPVINEEPVPAERGARPKEKQPHTDTAAAPVLPATAVSATAASSRTVKTAVERHVRIEHMTLKAHIIAAVKDLVASSPSPILLARASQHVVSKIGPQVLQTQWAGMGSFKRLLQAAENLGLEITTQPEPGYLYDPARHEPPSFSRLREGQPSAASALPKDLPQQSAAPQEIAEEGEYLIEPLGEEFDEDEDHGEHDEEYDESLPTLEEFARRVCQVTGAPDLSSRQYAMVFRGIVNELQQIAEGAKVYNTYQSSKAVSDWCAQQGEPAGRNDIVLVFKGIIFQDGVRFGKRPGSYTARELAAVVRNNIKALCRRSRLELSEYEERLLDEWILGDLETEVRDANNDSAPVDEHSLSTRPAGVDEAPANPG